MATSGAMYLSGRTCIYRTYAAVVYAHMYLSDQRRHVSGRVVRTQEKASARDTARPMWGQRERASLVRLV